MTQSEWLISSNPKQMLGLLVDRASERKLCLFAIACYRCNWDFLDKSTRFALETAERFAEDQITLAELRAANAGHFVGDIGNPTIGIEGIKIAANHAAWDVSFDTTAAQYPDTNELPDGPLNAAARASEIDNYHIQEQVQCHLLRDIFGSTPFHPISITPSVLAWNDGVIGKMSNRIYEERNFDLMPLLADALEEASCNDDDILLHCREPGLHVRGCWVIDLILGKK